MTAVARDAAGNQATAAAVSVTVNNAPDTTPPSAAVTAPADGASVSGVAVSVSANAADNVTIAGVQFRLDGANVGPEIHSPPYAMSWNSTSVPNGVHTITAVARDPTGNLGTSPPVDVTVSNVASCSTQTILATSAAVSDSGFAYMVSKAFGTPADNNSNPTGSLLRLIEDGVELGPAHSLHDDVRTSGHGRFSHWSGVGGANEAVRFSASDNSDPRTNGRTYTYCVSIPDTTAPVVSIVLPANGTSVTGSTAVSANATDNVGVIGVQFKLDGADLGGENLAYPFTASWNTETAANGTHQLGAVARDAAATRRPPCR